MKVNLYSGIKGDTLKPMEGWKCSDASCDPILRPEEIEIRYSKTLMGGDLINQKRLWLHWPRQEIDAYGTRYIDEMQPFTMADFDEAYRNLLIQFCNKMANEKK